MQHQFRLMLTEPWGLINFQYKLKGITRLKINIIRYFQNTVASTMLICFNGFTQQINNSDNINYTKDFELFYNNTFALYESSNLTNDYVNIEDPKDINSIKYIIYIDGIIATTTQISPTNPLYINITFF